MVATLIESPGELNFKSLFLQCKKFTLKVVLLKFFPEYKNAYSLLNCA